MKSNFPYYIWFVANWLYRHHIPFIPLVIQQLLRMSLCCFIPYETKIGKNVNFGHLGMGIVLHREVVIGDSVQINQHVTIGGRVGPGVPKIGNNVIIGAGAKVLGPITIGSGASIGANAVVIDDVPSKCTAVGVPAKIVKR